MFYLNRLSISSLKIIFYIVLSVCLFMLNQRVYAQENATQISEEKLKGIYEVPLFSHDNSKYGEIENRHFQDKSSIFKRFFNSHITDNSATPRNVKDLVLDHSSFFSPVILSSLEDINTKINVPSDKLSLTTSAQNLNQASNISDKASAIKSIEQILYASTFNLKEVDIYPYTEIQTNISYQLGLGLNYVSYLLHLYTPLTKEYTVPIIYIKPQVVDRINALASKSVNFNEHKAVVNHHNDKLNEFILLANNRDYLTPFAIAQLSQLWPKNNQDGLLTIDSLNLAMDLNYQDSKCSGLTSIEADLKSYCPASLPLDGLILLSMPHDKILKEGIYSDEQKQLSSNVLKFNAFALGVELGARLVGFNSALNVAYQGFEMPIRTFDRHLYSPINKLSLYDLSSNKANFIKLKQIANQCALNRQDNCDFYFIGDHTNDLLKLGNYKSYFNLHNQKNLHLNNDKLNVKAISYIDKSIKPDERLEHYQDYLDFDKNNLSEDKLAVNNAMSTREEVKSKILSNAVQGHKLESEVYEDSFQENEFITSSSIDSDSIVVDQVKSKSNLYGIPVRFNSVGQPFLALRNTLLSASQYKNYNFLTEAEMRVLMDLGYQIELKEHFGTSIYSFGTPHDKVSRIINQDFAYYDHVNEDYNIKKAATMPWAIGAHIYGSYNDIVHSSDIFTSGFGSMGVRIDGSENYYYQSPSSNIVTKGDESVAIAFTYGRDNSAYISGYVGASGEKSIGIKVDMGSNIYSDLVEYHGSYTRVRTLDYINGLLSQNQAQAFELLDDLSGPQVKDLTIDGVVEGSYAAIVIDESSLVKDINLTANAVINGNIFSSWHPFSKGDNAIYIRHDGKNNALLDAKLQIERPLDMPISTFINQELNTNLNLGVLLDSEHKVVREESFNTILNTKAQAFNFNLFTQAYAQDNYDVHDLVNTLLHQDDSVLQDKKGKIIGDIKSQVVLNGDISGSALNIRNYGGKSTILGAVRANKIVVHKGMLALHGKDKAINQVNTLHINSNGVLDLANGKSSHTYIQDRFYFGHNATIRLDVDAKGRFLDQFSLNGYIKSLDYQLTFEPALDYEKMRSLAADPKALLDFIHVFMANAYKNVNHDNINIRFPKYIWDSTGNYGRELRCSAKGCRIGAFVSSLKLINDEIPSWRYYLSFISIAVFILAYYAWFLFKRFRT